MSQRVSRLTYIFHEIGLYQENFGLEYSGPSSGLSGILDKRQQNRAKLLSEQIHLELSFLPEIGELG